MSVTWVGSHAWTPSTAGSVAWAAVGAPAAYAPSTAAAASWTYSGGILWGWTGSIFHATMTGLTPGALYNYSVSTGPSMWSDWRVFRAAPAPSSDTAVRIGVLADMGTVQLFGWAVADLIIKEHRSDPFGMVLIAGDLSYATVSPPKYEIESLWDAWAHQNEPFSSSAPFMMTVGNHESSPGTVTNASGTFNQTFAAFSARFRMPSNGNANLWFAYE
jgi:hypothetical protein